MMIGTIVAGGNMLTTIIIHSLIVFAITLTITKSKLLECHRKFVKERYEFSKNIKKPCFLHTWWSAIWNCAMCSGFWISLLTAFFLYSTVSKIMIGTFCAYAINWILHCCENALFWFGKYFENKVNKH